MARFRFDPDLIETLGKQYHSSEAAIAELVANAWDADATRVEIVLPEPMTADPILISDDGYGMSPGEIERYFLRVGYDRQQARGDTTPRGRRIRGLRGIGKFAGLQVAETMFVTTVSGVGKTSFTLNREALRYLADTLETADITLTTTPTDGPAGTSIELTSLRQSFAFPSADKLARHLLQQFGRRDDFAIVINHDEVGLDVLQGSRDDITIELRDGQTLRGTIRITDKPSAVADPGILIRVNGRAVGPPTYFGLDQDPEIPKSLLKRVAGEIHADHLVDDTLANWSGFVENSTGFQALVDAVKPLLRARLLEVQRAEAGSAPEAFIAEFDEKIERLPRSRRELARDALYRVFRRFYDETLDRKRAVAELVLNTFERDEYWVLVRRIDEMSILTVGELADILEQWGLYEIGEIAHRARQRLAIVEKFQSLAWDRDALELQDIHRMLEKNVWLIGDQYEVYASNLTLKRIIEDVAQKRYRGSRSRDRPDLILTGTADNYLLLELKRPSHRVDRNDVAQAQRYRDDILEHLGRQRIDICVIGGSVELGLATDENFSRFATAFPAVLDSARRRLEWLVANLSLDERALDEVDAEA